MRLWLTKVDYEDLLFDGIKRNRIWFQQPVVSEGYVCMFSRSRVDDYSPTRWQGNCSVSVRELGKTLSGPHRDALWDYIAAQLRSTYKWPELEWFDWLEKIDEVTLATREEWYATHNSHQYEHYGLFCEAARDACERAISKDEQSSQFAWCHQFNLFDILSVK